VAFDPPSSQDSQAYDSPADAERVELIGVATITGTVDQGAAGAAPWLVTVSGGTVAVTQSTSPWVVSAGSLPLPAGAATQATVAELVTAVRELEATVLLGQLEALEWAGA
jgi:hypothetical protein